MVAPLIAPLISHKWFFPSSCCHFLQDHFPEDRFFARFIARFTASGTFFVSHAFPVSARVYYMYISQNHVTCGILIVAFPTFCHRGSLDIGDVVTIRLTVSATVIAPGAPCTVSVSLVSAPGKWWERANTLFMRLQPYGQVHSCSKVTMQIIVFKNLLHFAKPSSAYRNTYSHSSSSPTSVLHCKNEFLSRSHGILHAINIKHKQDNA